MPFFTGAFAAALLAWTSTAVVTAASLDTTSLAKKYFGNDAPWYQARIPYFEISDGNIQDVYYYRWKIFRAHQRDLGQRGYVSTGECRRTYYLRTIIDPVTSRIPRRCRLAA
jgi:hypothetical protein